MSDTSDLEFAATGDTIQGADLQSSIDVLLAQAKALDEQIKASIDVEKVQALGRTQQDLRSAATSLLNVQIALIAGQVKVTAAHVNGATKFAEEIIAKIADWRRKVQTLGKLVDFFAVVLTGSGTKILQAAVGLKATLGQA
jgi:hypothetical protein